MEKDTDENEILITEVIDTTNRKKAVSYLNEQAALYAITGNDMFKDKNNDSNF